MTTVKRGFTVLPMSDGLERVLEKTAPVVLARELGIAIQAITGWKKAKRVPVERVLEVSRISGVPPHVIRPDIYPVPKRSNGARAA